MLFSYSPPHAFLFSHSPLPLFLRRPLFAEAVSIPGRVPSATSSDLALGPRTRIKKCLYCCDTWTFDFRRSIAAFCACIGLLCWPFPWPPGRSALAAPQRCEAFHMEALSHAFCVVSTILAARQVCSAAALRSFGFSHACVKKVRSSTDP